MTLKLEAEPRQADAPTFCYRHPETETGLRCNNCGRYICAKCAQRTPVGYRCPECIRNQQDVFFTMTPANYAIGGGVAFALTVPIVWVLAQLPLLLLILIGIPAGGLVSEAVHRALRRKRGRYTYLVVAGAVVAGGIVAMAALNWPFLSAVIGATAQQLRAAGVERGDILAALLPRLVTPGIITAILAITAAARFRYGK